MSEAGYSLVLPSVDESADPGNSGTTTLTPEGALRTEGSRGLLQFIDAEGMVRKAMYTCLEQMLAVRRSSCAMRLACADALACICMGRNAQCGLVLLPRDIEEVVTQVIRAAGKMDHNTQSSTKLATILFLCSLSEAEDTHQLVFGDPRHTAIVLAKCLDLISCGKLAYAIEAACAFKTTLLELVESQDQEVRSTGALTQLLQVCAGHSPADAEEGPSTLDAEWPIDFLLMANRYIGGADNHSKAAFLACECLHGLLGKQHCAAVAFTFVQGSGVQALLSVMGMAAAPVPALAQPGLAVQILERGIGCLHQCMQVEEVLDDTIEHINQSFGCTVLLSALSKVTSAGGGSALKALRMLCTMAHSTEGRDNILAAGGLPQIASYGDEEPEEVLTALDCFCTSSVPAHHHTMVQCQPALRALTSLLRGTRSSSSARALQLLNRIMAAAAQPSPAGEEAAHVSALELSSRLLDAKIVEQLDGLLCALMPTETARQVRGRQGAKQPPTPNRQDRWQHCHHHQQRGHRAPLPPAAGMTWAEAVAHATQPPPVSTGASASGLAPKPKLKNPPPATHPAPEAPPRGPLASPSMEAASQPAASPNPALQFQHAFQLAASLAVGSEGAARRILELSQSSPAHCGILNAAQMLLGEHPAAQHLLLQVLQCYKEAKEARGVLADEAGGAQEASSQDWLVGVAASLFEQLPDQDGAVQEPLLLQAVALVLQFVPPPVAADILLENDHGVRRISSLVSTCLEQPLSLEVLHLVIIALTTMIKPGDGPTLPAGRAPRVSVLLQRITQVYATVLDKLQTDSSSAGSSSSSSSSGAMNGGSSKSGCGGNGSSSSSGGSGGSRPVHPQSQMSKVLTLAAHVLNLSHGAAAGQFQMESMAPPIHQPTRACAAPSAAQRSMQAPAVASSATSIHAPLPSPTRNDAALAATLLPVHWHGMRLCCKVLAFASAALRAEQTLGQGGCNVGLLPAGSEQQQQQQQQRQQQPVGKWPTLSAYQLVERACAYLQLLCSVPKDSDAKVLMHDLRECLHDVVWALQKEVYTPEACTALASASLTMCLLASEFEKEVRNLLGKITEQDNDLQAYMFALSPENGF